MSHISTAFPSLPEARIFCREHGRRRYSQNQCSFTLEPGGRGRGAFVTITKTGDCALWLRGEIEDLEKESAGMKTLVAPLQPAAALVPVAGPLGTAQRYVTNGGVEPPRAKKMKPEGAEPGSAADKPIFIE